MVAEEVTVVKMVHSSHDAAVMKQLWKKAVALFLYVSRLLLLVTSLPSIGSWLLGRDWSTTIRLLPTLPLCRNPHPHKVTRLLGVFFIPGTIMGHNVIVHPHVITRFEPEFYRQPR